MNIRDFIYLDTERLKSIFSQIDQGLIGTTSSQRTHTAEASLSGEGGVPFITKAGGSGKYAFQNQGSETRTLHDYIFNKVEEFLVENSKLVMIPGLVNPHEILRGNAQNYFTETSYVLIKGQVQLNDYTTLQKFIKNFNKMGDFLSYLGSKNLPDGLKHSDIQKHKQNLKKSMQLEKDLVSGFELVFELFYQNRIAIKISPFQDLQEFRCVGDLKQEFLRDSISSIIYKYGSAPVSEWYIFGQIASIPPIDWEAPDTPAIGAAIEIAMSDMFNKYRALELLAQSVVFPEIAITPIAVYRQ